MYRSEEIAKFDVQKMKTFKGNTYKEVHRKRKRIKDRDMIEKCRRTAKIKSTKASKG